MYILQTSQTDTQQPTTPLQPLGISGLGGWLVLVQIGMYLTILLLAIQIFQNNITAFEPDVWDALTSKDSSFYHALWAPTIIFELIYNVSFLLFTIVMLFMFYFKKAVFPKLAILFYIISLIVTVIDLILAYQIPLARELMDSSEYRDIFKAIITCAIWVPYFLKSERVQNTFIR